MNLLIDKETGEPRWNATSLRNGPKEDFAFEAAKRLASGKLTLELLRNQIIEAANIEWSRQGRTGSLENLNEVAEFLGKSGKSWFFEMQRVASHPDLIALLIAQEGRGLTALARKAGPIQAQRRKGFSDLGPDNILKDLIDTLSTARRISATNKALANKLQEVCASDLLKYRRLLEGGKSR